MLARRRVWHPLFAPVVEGAFLDEFPIRAFRNHSPRPVPVLAGSNGDEYGSIVRLAPMTQPEAIARFDASGVDGSSAYRVYASGMAAGARPEQVWNAALTDIHFRVPADRLLEAVASHGQPAFGYLFDWKSPAENGALGAFHGLDVLFMSGLHGLVPDIAGSGPASDALAGTMMDAWVAFARTGDPSTPGLSWPRFDPEERTVMVLGERCHPVTGYGEAERRIWDGVIP
jgi:para-nitrobenzyl esterase